MGFIISPAYVGTIMVMNLFLQYDKLVLTSIWGFHADKPWTEM